MNCGLAMVLVALLGSEASDGFAESVRTVVPKTWKLNVQGKIITASRDVEFFDTSAARYGRKKGTFAVAFELGPVMTGAAHEQLRAKNEQVRAKLARLSEEMSSFACERGEAGCFKPKKKSQRAQVAAHEKLAKSFQKEPSFHLDQWVTVTMVKTLNEQPAKSSQLLICEDCESTAARLSELLIPYAREEVPGVVR